MIRSVLLKIPAFFFAPLFFVLPITTYAQVQLPEICSSPQTTEQRNQCATLKREIEQLTRDEKKLAEQKEISGSLSKEVTQLTAEINKKKNDIIVKNKLLLQLSGQINEKVKTIKTLEEKRNQQEISLSQILRKKNQLENYTFTEWVLFNTSLSKFLIDLDQFRMINNSIQESFDTIRGVKRQTSEEKATLEDKKRVEDDAKYALETQKKNVEMTQAEKNRVLEVSKGQEKNYEEVIKDRQARIASIRAELIRFQGSGIENRSISFGEAYDYARAASAKTGVRTALILAIMQQETGFGNNVGGCYLRDGEKGTGIFIKTGKPSERNIVPGNFNNFISITKNLRRDWKMTPISCAMITSLKIGSTGENVRKIQNFLNVYENKKTTVDGFFGNGTHTSIIKFQKDMGETADGIIGMGTIYAMQDWISKQAKNSSKVAQLKNDITPSIVLYGYGGAMGYTQFIPNTWMTVEAQVREYTKAAVADPWNPQHAVFATAIFLRDRGAASQTYTTERAAACSYYGACSTHNYGDQVMQKATTIQKTIDQLNRLNR